MTHGSLAKRAARIAASPNNEIIRRPPESPVVLASTDTHGASVGQETPHGLRRSGVLILP